MADLPPDGRAVIISGRWGEAEGYRQKGQWVLALDGPDEIITDAEVTSWRPREGTRDKALVALGQDWKTTG